MAPNANWQKRGAAIVAALAVVLWCLVYVLNQFLTVCFVVGKDGIQSPAEVSRLIAHFLFASGATSFALCGVVLVCAVLLFTAGHRAKVSKPVDKQPPRLP
jgi:hypothetical protein